MANLPQTRHCPNPGCGGLMKLGYVGSQPTYRCKSCKLDSEDKLYKDILAEFAKKYEGTPTLSKLKYGDKFKLIAMPYTVFTLINPRLGIFSLEGRCQFAYISDTHQMYGSPWDIPVTLVRDEDKQDKFPVLNLL